VDGVLTDGGMYYGSTGELLKRFNTRDGMGMRRLRDAGVHIVWITQEDSDIVRVRATKLQVPCFTGIMDKAAKVREVCASMGIDLSASAYIGDDVNDIAAMQLVGIAAAPADAEEAVRVTVDVVCTRRGGEGAFREFAEYLLKEGKIAKNR